METPAALLILIASIAIGIASAAFFSRRHRKDWRRNVERDDSPYRAGTTELVGMPTVVRVPIGLSILMAVMCAFRVAASIDDVLNLTDEPHVRLNLAPRGPLATVLEVTLAFAAIATGLRLYGAARALAARRPTPHVNAAFVLLLVSTVLATATVFAITRVPIVIYWQRRMVLYLVVHGVLATATAVAIAFARQSPSRER